MNNGQMVLAFNSSGTSPSSKALTDRFLWGPAVDQLLADETVADPCSPGVVDWALTDNQESVREWIGSNGSVTGQVDYSAFGQRSNASGFAAAADVIFGYTGTFYDAATNEDNDVNRWYDVDLGTWTSQDPIGFAGGQTNLSEYVGDDPTNGVDPLGLDVYVENTAAAYGFHQRITVDTWTGGRKTGSYSISFGFDQTIMAGMVYVDTGKPTAESCRTKTTYPQDLAILAYLKTLVGRTGFYKAYGPGTSNCRLFSSTLYGEITWQSGKGQMPSGPTRFPLDPLGVPPTPQADANPGGSSGSPR